jgi:NAD(P)H-hydrate epimerase
MTAVFSRAQVRALERRAVEAGSISELDLMENAGRGATEQIASWLRAPSARVVVVAGGGNNAGDGFVVARHLLSLGHRPLVVLLEGADRLREPAQTTFDSYLGSGGPVLAVCRSEQLIDLERELAAADCIVDAIFGIGLSREIEGHHRAAIELINRVRGARSRSEFGATHPVVALDIASGLDADNGQVLGVAVRADATISFAGYKLGILTSLGADLSGEVSLVDIGVAVSGESAEIAASLITADEVAAALPRRRESMHKGDAGRVVVFAGSAGKMGAALLVARAALRAGAGLVTIAGFEEVTRVLDARVLEEMTVTIDAARVAESVKQICETADVVVMGPGLGFSEKARGVVDAVLFGFTGTKVIDADALTHLAGRLSEARTALGVAVLTPHPGEMGRLLGSSSEEVEADRWAALDRAVTESGAVVVLKGARTLVGAPGELPKVNVAHAPALATAGAGDVLSGTVAALAAILPARTAALSAVFLHGRAGEAWQKELGGDRGLLAHEIADLMPEVIAGLTLPR